MKEGGQRSSQSNRVISILVKEQASDAHVNTAKLVWLERMKALLERAKKSQPKDIRSEIGE